jgi:two-component system, NarL family, response regulator DesR
MIRILLAEDQGMVRGALAALLALEPDMEIVAEVARGDEVAARALESQPDVAMLNIEMPGADGLTAAAELRAKLPSCRVMILTTFGRPGYLRRAMESGAVGFLLKDAPAAQLAAAIRRVMAGERVVDPALAVSALSEGISPLTDRVRDVFATCSRRVRDVFAWREYRRDCVDPLPLGGHSAQLSLGRDAKAGRAQPHRGGASGRTNGRVIRHTRCNPTVRLCDCANKEAIR